MTEEIYDLSRFRSAQTMDYETALGEIRRGRKRTHWIWYIFPQLKGLGRSSMAEYYGIRDLGEAKAYLADPYLGAHLREITRALLALESRDPYAVMGSPDDLKLKSCMTLFELAAPEEEIFSLVLEQFFGGERDRKTISMVRAEQKK